MSEETKTELEKVFNLCDFGCTFQSTEMYDDLQNKLSLLDTFDKIRICEIILNKLFDVDAKLHPVVMRIMMEKLQNIEIICAKWKKMLGDVKINGIVCKKCDKMLPEMTLMMFINNVNSECPHDIEISID